MIADDEAALNLRFLEGMGLVVSGQDVDPAPVQVLGENVPARDLDTGQPWCRWTIEAGDAQRAASDGTTQQLGVATLQIIAPLGDYTSRARAIRDQFLTLFRDWRSPDRCLAVYQTSVTTPPSRGDYRINARVFWRSLRNT